MSFSFATVYNLLNTEKPLGSWNQMADYDDLHRISVTPTSFAAVLGIFLMSVCLLGAVAAPILMHFYHPKVMKDTSSPPDKFPEVKAENMQE
jgi:hypothetical protein